MDVLIEFHLCAGLKTNLHKSQMVFGGTNSNLQQHCLQTIGLRESSLPLQYLGVRIVASKLTKFECDQLVNKITTKVHQWTARNILYAGRLILINSVIFGMFNCWASIFLLPNEVIDRLIQISCNYVWSGTKNFKRPPHISWQYSCLPKSKGGLVIKEFAAWNKATIAKLVWAVADKKDILLVRWVHGRYIRGKNWWDYIPPLNSS